MIKKGKMDKLKATSNGVSSSFKFIFLLSFFLFLFFSIPLVSSGKYSDCEIYGNCVSNIGNFYLRNNGDSAIGNYTFNGGWENEGLSIIGGDIYAQTGYFVNITSLDVTKEFINITGGMNVSGNFSVDNPTFFIDSSLNRVGIGTSSPDTPLHIVGDVTLDPGDASQKYKVGYLTDGLAFQGQESGKFSSLDLMSKDGDGTDFVGLIIWGKGTTESPTNRERLKMFWDAGNSVFSVVSDQNGAGTLFPLTLYTEGNDNQIFLATDGKVGINTTTPQNNLNVLGDINATGLYYGNGSQLSGINSNFNSTAWNKSGSDVYLATTSDNVGIGTTSPDAVLHLVDGTEQFRFSSFSGGSTIGTNTSNAADNDVLFLDSTRDGLSTSRGAFIGAYGNEHAAFPGDLRLVSGSTGDVLVIGNVGIGTATPQNKLNVIGDGNFTGNLTTTHIIPNLNSTYDLGSSTKIFKNFWGNIGNFLGNVFIGGDLNVTGIFYNPTIYLDASDLFDQTYSTANVRQIINITKNDGANDITLSTGSDGTNITVLHDGAYFLDGQPQISSETGGSGLFYMWLEKYNGTDFVAIEDSAIIESLTPNAEVVGTLATTLILETGDVIRFASAVTNNKIFLDFTANFTLGDGNHVPNTPSFIFTMDRVGS